MQVFGLLFVAGFSAVLAQDQLWMELMSAQIVNAAGKNVETDKTIPQLAEDLGLKTLVELVTKAKLARTLASKGIVSLFFILHFSCTDILQICLLFIRNMS